MPLRPREGFMLETARSIPFRSRCFSPRPHGPDNQTGGRAVRRSKDKLRFACSLGGQHLVATSPERLPNGKQPGLLIL